MATAERSSASAEVVVAPPTGWGALDLRELWAHRELLYFLTKRELQVRYAQSFFGVAWVVLQPLVLAFILALFLGHFAHTLSGQGVPAAVFAVSGLVPWLFTAAAVTNAANSLVQDAPLISKVYFPRLALPLSKALSLLIDLAIALVVLLVITFVYGVGIQSTFFLVPVFLLLGIVSAFAVGTWFAAINVKYRDVGQVVPMLVQILFFLTPILYSSTIVPEKWQYILALNPMVAVIDGVRWSLYGIDFPHPGIILVSVGSALALLVGSLIYFHRTEQYFADVV